ncbi:efflux RND transporter periplasmic adaptor subunit [Methylophaga sp.]|uniref:efflux RND transporter periplasmic adaptor subunit n=1 Tax=Methylophaga sp. TaxID=2024840 RepID=UPI0025FFB8C5|nr:efflux RND transporter periplasmic adaptor subunit [Methylophaga sp.]
MKRSHQVVFFIAVIMIAITVLIATANNAGTPPENIPLTTDRPSLAVTVITPKTALLPITITANGNINAWQEASIGNETNGLKLDDVKVNVGDIVQRGQLLATFSPRTVKVELAQTQAALTEAEAVLAETRDNVKRAIELQATGALSAQQIQQYSTAEKTAQARLQSAQAYLDTQQLRLEQTQVLAPDDGIISARNATVGSVPPVGEELFRLIRGSRLEWRAEVSAEDLPKLKPGQRVDVMPVGGETVTGTLRILSPVVDIQTRNGLAYIDLPADNTLRAGTFARGKFELGATKVLTLPQSAVLLRDGFSYVLRVSSDSRIIQTKVSTGRRTADLVEIINGITPADKVVESGGAFLGDGDLVRVVETLPTANASSLINPGTPPQTTN